MRRNIYLIGSLVILGSCGSDETGKPKISYRNIRFSFTLQLPPRCQVVESPTGDSVRLSMPEMPGLSVFVYGCRNAWGLENVNDLKRLTENIGPNPLPTFRFIALGEMPGIEFDDSKVGELLVPRHRTYLNGNTLYGFCLESSSPTGQRALEFLDQICESLRT